MSKSPVGIVFFSNTTGNTKRFIEKLEWQGWVYQIPIQGEFTPPIPSGDYVLIVPSYGSPTNSHIPPQVKKWLTNPENRAGCIGTIGVGHINFGDEFGAAGKILSQKLGVPLLYIFELAGTTEDVYKVREGLLQLSENS